jgi:hypothetical protein
MSTSEEVQRCKHCWEEPVIMNVGNAWGVFCNCLMYSCTGSKDVYHTLIADAVAQWNREFGREACSGSHHQASQSVPSCTCDSQSLLWLGCTCEYARWKRGV